jgi:hypothetical protein
VIHSLTALWCSRSRSRQKYRATVFSISGFSPVHLICSHLFTFLLTHLLLYHSLLSSLLLDFTSFNQLLLTTSPLTSIIGTKHHFKSHSAPIPVAQPLSNHVESQLQRFARPNADGAPPYDWAAYESRHSWQCYSSLQETPHNFPLPASSHDDFHRRRIGNCSRYSVTSGETPRISIRTSLQIHQVRFTLYIPLHQPTRLQVY